MASPHRLQKTPGWASISGSTRSMHASQTRTGLKMAIAAPQTLQSDGIKVFMRSAATRPAAKAQTLKGGEL
jgi:hypothetical protein